MKMDVLSLVDLIWWWWSSCGSTERNITQQLCPGFSTQRSVKGMTDSSRVTDSLCSHAQLNGAVGASCWCSVSVSVYMQQRKQKKWRVSSPSSGVCVCVGSAGSYDPVLLTSLSPGYKQLHKLHKFSTTVPDQTRPSLSLSLSSFYRTHLSLVALWNALNLHWRRGLFWAGSGGFSAPLRAVLWSMCTCIVQLQSDGGVYMLKKILFQSHYMGVLIAVGELGR